MFFFVIHPAENIPQCGVWCVCFLWRRNALKLNHDNIDEFNLSFLFRNWKKDSGFRSIHLKPANVLIIFHKFCSERSLPVHFGFVFTGNVFFVTQVPYVDWLSQFFRDKLSTIFNFPWRFSRLFNIWPTGSAIKLRQIN